jgi:hypothetical protein
MMDIIKGKRTPEQVKAESIALKKEFSQVKYGFQSVEETLKYIKP